jgi:hypothetical protein
MHACRCASYRIGAACSFQVLKAEGGVAGARAAGGEPATVGNAELAVVLNFVYWRSPESGDVWYKSSQLKGTI